MFFIIILVLTWVLALCIINPIGDFPLNDDWTYAAVVKSLLSGHFSFPNYAAPTLVVQALWGALFCLPGGFSFTALRISTLILACVCSIVFYLTAFEIGKSKKAAFLLSLFLTLNPLFLSLSNTFMTDVPFLSFTALSVLFFIKAFNSGSVKHIIWATIFSALSVLVRQTGVVIPIAFGITALLQKRNVSAVKYFIPAAVVLPALFIYMRWATGHSPLFKPYQDNAGITDFFNEPGEIAFKAFKRVGYTLYYTGLFLFPALLYTSKGLLKQLNNKQKKIIALITLAFVPSLIRAWPEMPIGNMVTPEGFGPKLLRDAYILHINTSGLPYMFVIIMLVIGFTGGLLFVANVVKVVLVSGSRQQIFLIIAGGCYLCLSFLPITFFDRYLLFPIYAGLLLVCPLVNQLGKRTALMIPALTIGACIAVFGTHDYLAWNRARWDALNCLTNEMKISPEQIDGGFEFNGWTFGSTKYPAQGKSWWYVQDDEYLISFGDVPGYSAVKKFAYAKYLRLSEGNICILKRQ